MCEKPEVFWTRVISDGRITIPDDFRKLWQIEEGDMVQIKIEAVHKSNEVAVVGSKA